MKMKKVMAGLLCAAMLGVPSFAADNEIKVIIDGKLVSFDQPPIMDNNRVLVPFRGIFEALDAEVTYIEEPKSVMAVRGITDMYFEIGSDTVYVDNEEIKLDVPSKIVKNRTLVPVRAVSEGLDAKVSWDSLNRAVIITGKKTDHKITSEKLEKTVKTSDGTVIANMEFNYPVIENKAGDETADKLNGLLKKYAEDKMAEYENEFIGDDLEEHRVAVELTGRPYEFEMNFGVMYDKSGYLSVKYESYANLNGAHPITTVTSKTYDVKAAEEIAAEDVFKSDEAVEKLFAARIEKNPELFFGEALDTIKETPYEGFYLTDEGAVAYYNVYAIAAYAAGVQEVTAAYTSESDVFADSFLEAISRINEAKATEQVEGMLDAFCRFDIGEMTEYAAMGVTLADLPYQNIDGIIDMAVKEITAASPEVEPYKDDVRALIEELADLILDGFSYEIDKVTGENGKYTFDVKFTSYDLKNIENLFADYDAEAAVMKLIADGTVNDGMTDEEMADAVFEAVFADICDYVKLSIAAGRLELLELDMEFAVENVDGEWLVTSGNMDELTGMME